MEQLPAIYDDIKANVPTWLASGEQTQDNNMLDDIRVALAYVNQVGGQDELVFDGGSFVVNPGGELACARGDPRQRVLT